MICSIHCCKMTVSIANFHIQQSKNEILHNLFFFTEFCVIPVYS